MSPLTCSLFAFAALLATAHGTGNCNSKTVGSKSGTGNPLPPVRFSPPLTIIDEPRALGLCPPEMNIVAADITVCNNDADGPAPGIIGPLPGKLFPILVLCDEDDCPNGGHTQVTLYCDYRIKN